MSPPAPRNAAASISAVTQVGQRAGEREGKLAGALVGILLALGIGVGKQSADGKQQNGAQPQASQAATIRRAVSRTTTAAHADEEERQGRAESSRLRR